MERRCHTPYVRRKPRDYEGGRKTEVDKRMEGMRAVNHLQTQTGAGIQCYVDEVVFITRADCIIKRRDGRIGTQKTFRNESTCHMGFQGSEPELTIHQKF